MNLFGHLLFLSNNLGVPAIFTWVLLFFLPGCYKRGLWLQFFFSPFYTWIFNSSWVSLVAEPLRACEREELLQIVTICLNMVIVWEWPMAEIWQGKGTASWFSHELDVFEHCFLMNCLYVLCECRCIWETVMMSRILPWYAGSFSSCTSLVGS